MKVADATVAEVSEFLTRAFAPRDTRRMVGYARLAEFLSDDGWVKDAAVRLSEELAAEYPDPTGPDPEWLAGVLRREGDRDGFGPLVPLLNGQVPHGPFAAQVRAGELFRDVFTRPHGEYTHAVQWLLMAWHFRYDRTVDVLDLYKQSVRFTSRTPFADAAGGSARVHMWNWLVDCFQGPGEDFRTNIVCKTYRCPQYTTDRLGGSPLARYLQAVRSMGLKGGPPPAAPNYEKQRDVAMTADQLRAAGYKPGAVGGNPRNRSWGVYVPRRPGG